MGAAASVLQRSVDGAVESFLDEDERFVHLVMISFDDDADAQQQLPAGRVLKALVGVYELVAATLPPAGRRLVMRCACACGMRRSARLPLLTCSGPQSP